MTQAQSYTALLLHLFALAFISTVASEAHATTFTDTEVTSPTTEAPFHPLCLDQLGLFGRNFEARDIETISCEGPYTEAIERRENGWVYADQPRTPEGYPTGYIGYQIQSSTPLPKTSITSLWLNVVENGGGNADYSDIWHMHYNAQDNTLTPQHRLSGGDRCSGGQQRIHGANAQFVTYEHAASPYRLLNPRNNPEPKVATVGHFTSVDERFGWPKDRSENFMHWPFIRAVSDCYSCCAGALVKTLDLKTNRLEIHQILVDPGQRIDRFFERPDLIDCASDWFAQIQDPKWLVSTPTGEPRLGFTPELWAQYQAMLAADCEGVIPTVSP